MTILISMARSLGDSSGYIWKAGLRPPPIRVSGLIVGFDDPVVIGTWDITIQAATPLSAALPLFATGLGALGLFGWRRKRKNTAAIAAA